MQEDIAKVTKLRNNEYYFQQDLFDILYKKSKNNINFYNLIQYIASDKNIRLAYRNIKSNKGSKTNGLSGKNISIIAKMKLNYYIREIKDNINNYIPSKIKRIGIPKANGKVRYLGIKEPCDKIVEQSIYQILEPILTAKFHNNSNGFISGRSCQRAIAQFNNYVLKNKLYFVIDIDIKSFFDNVNHGKLIKQLWAAGIRDKNLLKLISKMLKAEIHKVGVPEKGTPQGGILSPLLANLVLNELDWWLDSKSNLGIRFVRYADDVRILCPTYSIARNMLETTTRWLNKRLKLEISNEKTKIVNLRRNYTDFLGCRIKVRVDKKGKWKIHSTMSNKALEKCKSEIKKRTRLLNKHKSDKNITNQIIDNLNSYIMGIQNYYRMNSNIKQDLRFINYLEIRYLIKNLSDVLIFKDKINQDNYIFKTYGINHRLPCIRGKPIIPIGIVECITPKAKSEEATNFFSSSNRKKLHKELLIDNMFILEKFLYKSFPHESVEYNDNFVSKFCGQRGKFAITNKIILDINAINIVKINKINGDKYNNLLIVDNKIKHIVELEEVDDIIIISKLKRGLTYEQLEKINKIRKENRLSPI